MESAESQVTRHQISLDGVIIDTTTEPKTINLHLHGIRIIIPITDEIEQQLNAKPRDFRLLLEIR